MYEIGKNIKSMREARGISQKDFAKMIDSKNTTVSSWEKGVSRPNADTLVAICSVLDVSADELLGIKISNSVETNLKEDELTKLFRQLDDWDKGTIIGEMRGMLRAEKYSSKKESLNA